MFTSINGILLLDKPPFFTSNLALQRVKHLFKAKKAGHTGSLDPIATGMLPICFGQATKFSQFLLNSDKVYRVVAKLGVQTSTGDSEGEVIKEEPVKLYSKEEVEAVLDRFVGVQEQLPPMYSAIKQQGMPLYKLARQGIVVERQPRTINITSIVLEDFNQDLLSFQVHCSKGTYIRTLVEDIGNQLGCGGHVIQLRRTRVLPYDNFPMYTVAMLEAILENNGRDALQETLLPIETSVNLFPALKLTTSAVFYLKMGQAVRTSSNMPSRMVRLLSEDAKFIGIGEVMPDGRVKPHRLVA